MYIDQINQLRKENPFLNYADIVYDLVLDDIIWGKFTSDTRLKESVLAEECGMSRSPVKEALRRLEEHGFLTRKDNLPGYGITPFDITDYADFCELRLCIEPQAAYNAARYISNSGRFKLKETMEEWEKAAKDRKVNRLHILDDRFHRIIVKESKNRYFQEIYDSYSKKNLYFRRMVYFSGINTHYNEKKHMRILCCIEEHDEKGAMEEMQAHLSFALKNGIQRLKQVK